MEPSLLEDFIEQEVFDRKAKLVGVLACYWEAKNGELFLGVMPKGQDCIRVVPGEGAELDEAHCCVQLGFDAATVRAAPLYDCDLELQSGLETAAHRHFGMASSRS